MVDGHAHSEYSFDSKATVDGYISEARARGFDYLAVTDHFDPDFAEVYEEKIKKGMNAHPGNKIDLHEYNEALKGWQKVADSRGVNLARGIEIAWFKGDKPWLKTLPDFDVIINSVHTVKGIDPVRNPEFFENGIKSAFDGYIATVLASLDLDADWSVVAHFGYASRYVPTGEKIMRYAYYKEGIDEVLAGIIKRDKSLEFNSKLTNDLDVFRRYYELGGRKISFGSDAHASTLIGNNYDATVRALAGIGFDHWTMYKGLRPVRYEF